MKTCPFVEQEIRRLAKSQHKDDHQGVIPRRQMVIEQREGRREYSVDKQKEVDQVFCSSEQETYEAAIEWWEETNLSVWYDIE